MLKEKDQAPLNVKVINEHGRATSLKEFLGQRHSNRGHQ